MNMKGIDYSWARPGGAAIRAAGFEFAVRYVPYTFDGGKGLIAPELADLHANGVAVALVFESIAKRALEGPGAGVADAKTVLASLQALKWPPDRPVYFAVDFDATPEQQAAIDDYLRGAVSVLGPERVGVYGGYWVIKRCFENKSASWFWQTAAWSGGQVHPAAHLYQFLNGQKLNGGDVDYNEAKQGDFGQWFSAPAQVDPLAAFNAALQMRFALVRLANDPDLPTIERAYNLLKGASLL